MGGREQKINDENKESSMQAKADVPKEARSAEQACDFHGVKLCRLISSYPFSLAPTFLTLTFKNKQTNCDKGNALSFCSSEGILINTAVVLESAP